MDIQTKIRDALADFDDLLIKGHPIDEALCIASSENGVSERVLESRASREMTLEERRDLVIRQAEGDRKSAKQTTVEHAATGPDGYWARSPTGKKVWIGTSTLETKNQQALAALEELLPQGLSIDDALHIASTENGISMRALESRANREVCLEQRRNMVIRQAERDRQSALQASTNMARPRREGYWVTSPSGKRVWVDPSQSQFEF